MAFKMNDDGIIEEVIEEIQETPEEEAVEEAVEETVEETPAEEIAEETIEAPEETVIEQAPDYDGAINGLADRIKALEDYVYSLVKNKDITEGDSVGDADAFINKTEVEKLVDLMNK